MKSWIGLSGAIGRIPILGISKNVAASYLRPRTPHAEKIQLCFRDKIGLEIGGPSPLFSRWGLLPFYTVVRRLDYFNYTTANLLDSVSGLNNRIRYVGSRFGNRFLAQGDCIPIASESYDFLVSSHVLEHIANPLKALKDWIRILRPNGFILIVVPDKLHTFDHRRPYTSFAHLERDYIEDVGENDLTHQEEVYALQDFSRDSGYNSLAQFRESAEKNLEKRVIHHHVYSQDLIREVFSYVGLEELAISTAAPCHIFGLAQKTKL